MDYSCISKHDYKQQQKHFVYSFSPLVLLVHVLLVYVLVLLVDVLLGYVLVIFVHVLLVEGAAFSKRRI